MTRKNSQINHFPHLLTVADKPFYHTAFTLAIDFFWDWNYSRTTPIVTWNFKPEPHAPILGLMDAAGFWVIWNFQSRQHAYVSPTSPPFRVDQVFAMTSCWQHACRKNWTFLLYVLTVWSMTWIFCGAHLCAPYRFVYFHPQIARIHLWGQLWLRL